MNHRTHRKRAALSGEAAQWFVRLRDNELHFSAQLQYLRWLKGSPSHIAEMLRICRLYALLKSENVGAIMARADQVNAVIDLDRTKNR